MARPHGGARLDRAGLASGLWRRRTRPGGDQDPARGDGAAALPQPAQFLWHIHAGAGPAQVRDRGAEARSPAQDRARRNPLVSGLFRTRAPGSDLAGLQTWAEDAGDHFVVNGQKVWTSYADKADWIFCLVRTDKASKQGGISFLLFDMEDARRHHQADPADLRLFALLRDLLRRCEGAQSQSGRRAEQGAGTWRNTCSATSGR